MGVALSVTLKEIKKSFHTHTHTYIQACCIGTIIGVRQHNTSHSCVRREKKKPRMLTSQFCFVKLSYKAAVTVISSGLEAGFFFIAGPNPRLYGREQKQHKSKFPQSHIYMYSELLFF